MMDHKSWLWKKKSTEKTLVALAGDKTNLSLSKNEDYETHLADKADLERDLNILHQKLSSAISECNAKDDFAKKQERMAKEAIAGWDKAEAEVILLKQELDKVLQQKIEREERLVHLDAALKECMQQLCFVREEQEKRIHDAVMKALGEYEKAKNVLEEKLAEIKKKLMKLTAENAQLSKTILAKEKVIEELIEHRSRKEADFAALITRLESSEKENASLKYEVRVLEKELDIRNEEREFNRRTADVAHRQYQDSVKKIAKLESECQRLRVLVRKRLPGPAALAKMKNEVQMLGKDPAENRRRKSNPSTPSSMDLSVDIATDSPSRRNIIMNELLCALQEENTILREALNRRTNELHTAEALLEESSKCLPAQQELSLASISDMGSDDKISPAESWALISEMDHFRNGKQKGTPSRKSIGASDINLMDDFTEMEKLAVLSADKGEEKVPGWIDDILKLVLEKKRVMGRHPKEIVENIKAALARMELQNPSESAHAKDKSSLVDSSDEVTGCNTLSAKESNGYLQSNESIPINKVIEIIEGINLLSAHEGNSETLSGKNDKDNPFPYKYTETPTGYTVRVFQWKTSELKTVLRKFVETCRDLLSKNVTFDSFADELSSALEWIMNHCFSLQDVSSMKESIKTHFDWDESRSECEVEGVMINPLSEESRRLEDELVENQIQDHKMVKEDRAAKAEFSEAHEKISSLEKRLGNRKSSSEKLEATCHDLQHQQESVVNRDVRKCDEQEDKLLRSDLEIEAASEKLAECQETILNLGKQLKAFASPREASKFVSTLSNTNTAATTPMKTTVRRSSLLDKMLADDDDDDSTKWSPNIKEVTAYSKSFSSLSFNGVKDQQHKTLNGSLAIVPVKGKADGSSGGLLKRLLWRRKKGKKGTPSMCSMILE